MVFGVKWTTHDKTKPSYLQQNISLKIQIPLSLFIHREMGNFLETKMGMLNVNF